MSPDTIIPDRWAVPTYEPPRRRDKALVAIALIPGACYIAMILALDAFRVWWYRRSTT